MIPSPVAMEKKKGWVVSVIRRDNDINREKDPILSTYTGCKEEFVLERIINDASDDLGFDCQGNRDTGKGEIMNKIGSAVNRIDDPSRGIGQGRNGSSTR